MKVVKIIVFIIILIIINANIVVALNIKNEKQAISGSKGYIQSLIDQASPGDTINILSGTYHEDIYINKRLNLIGNNKADTIIFGTGNQCTVRILADNVKISGFTIKNTYNSDRGGISMYSNTNIITDNIITENSIGISIASSTFPYKDTLISNNIVFNNSDNGISLFLTKDCTIENNIITDNRAKGMRVSYSSNIEIIGNTITYNDDDGISFWDSHNNLVDNNEISHNSESGIFSWSDSTRGTFVNNRIIFNGNDGIFIDTPYIQGNFLVKDNKIISNGRNGIRIQNSNANTIQNNEIMSNKYGVELIGSDNNEVIINNISGNQYGILIESDYEISILNKFYYNNFIANIVNAHDECTNIWYNIVTKKGNYWDDYTGRDINNDGIGDTPYNIEGGSNKDNYPLIDPYGDKTRVRIRNNLIFYQLILLFLSYFNKLK